MKRAAQMYLANTSSLSSISILLVRRFHCNLHEAIRASAVIGGPCSTFTSRMRCLRDEVSLRTSCYPASRASTRRLPQCHEVTPLICRMELGSRSRGLCLSHSTPRRHGVFPPAATVAVMCQVLQMPCGDGLDAVRI